MKITPVRALISLGALCALALTATGQIVELRATLNQAQEVPPTGAPGTGTAIMLFNVVTAKFDLVVSINGMSNVVTDSHIHEGEAGANGAPVVHLGGESAYARSGSSLSRTFHDLTYTGDKLKLIKSGAYFNIHSAQFPNGEIRGQFVAQPVRLVSKMDVAQEAVAMPTQNFAGLNDFGGAVMIYNPATNQISLRSSIFNFNNTFSNSHFHIGAPGVSGGVVHNLGNNPNAGIYSNTSGAIQGSFDGAYLGDPVDLLSGRHYLNYHSTAFSGGELRGQVTVSNETIPTSRMINIATRGFVGTGEQVMIAGFVVGGNEPVRVLITAKGPSLAAFGVTGGVANPVLTLHDSAGRQIARNDDVGTLTAELAAVPAVPRTAVESALVVVLPPGNYTAIVSSATAASGVALVEVYDMRGFAAASGPN